MFLSHLLFSRRFLPLFITQFLGALNDNFFKTAVVILVTYRTSQEWHVSPQTLVTLAAALYILPYTLFCATAGKLADRYNKATMAQLIKLAEVTFMLVAAVGFLFHLIGFLFVVLFCMGAHSAFFSPVKYALMPEHLKRHELMEGNAYMEGVTFIAILLGTIAGGLLVLRSQGEIAVSVLMCTIAVLGAAASRFIPPAPSEHPDTPVQWNVFRETQGILSYIIRKPAVLKTALANSWFWFICMTFATLIPAFTKQILGADEDVVTLTLISFSVGIGFGTVGCGTLLKGKLSTRSVAVGAVGMSLFVFDLYRASPHSLAGHPGPLLTLAQFLARPGGIRIMADLFLFAFSGGFYIVPLYALLQHQSEPRYRARVMACNNVLNAFFMIASAGLAVGMFALGFTVADVFLADAVLNTAVALLLWLPVGRFAEG